MVRQATGSCNVARQMQDRTHKGGAVLWFLRKHAPMPLAYACGLGDDDVTPSKHNASQEASTTYGSGVGSANPKAAALGPQRKFLHGTLKVIGTELDNQMDAKADGFGRTPHPQGSRMDSQTAAWGVRENLRRRYASHTDSELEQLEAAVQAKEQEVQALRKQVDQMERYLAATLAASARRACRMREGRDDSPSKQAGLPPGVSASLASAIVKTKKNFMAAAGATVWDDAEGAPRSQRENVIEEWQHIIMRQSEVAQTMRAHVDEQAKALQQQTIQRKAQEAQLFASHAVTLRLRAQMQQAESRVQRLANELTRVYHSLPQTMAKKLHAAQTAGVRNEQMGFELRGLQEEHHRQTFKYMNTESIIEETDQCQKRITEMDEVIALAQRMLDRSSFVGESSGQHAKAAWVAINSVHDRWTRFVSAGLPAGGLFVKDKQGMNVDADSILQRGQLEVNALAEMLDVMHRGRFSEIDTHIAPHTHPKSPSQSSEAGPVLQISSKSAEAGSVDVEASSQINQDETAAAGEANLGPLEVSRMLGPQDVDSQMEKELPESPAPTWSP